MRPSSELRSTGLGVQSSVVHIFLLCRALRVTHAAQLVDKGLMPRRGGARGTGDGGAIQARRFI